MIHFDDTYTHEESELSYCSGCDRLRIFNYERYGNVLAGSCAECGQEEYFSLIDSDAIEPECGV